MRHPQWIAVLALAAAVAGCTSSKPSSTQTSANSESATTTANTAANAGTLNVTRDGPLEPIFDPVMATDNTFALMYLIYDPLISIAPDQTTLQPRLAQSWTASSDAKTYTLNLRHDVKWQDGTTFTATDVVFTATWAAHYPSAYQGRPQNWTEIAGAASIAGTNKPLSGIQAVNDYTVKITLAKPDSSFLRELVDAPNVIVPEHLLKNETDKTINSSNFATHPVGTGPYKLTKYLPNQYVQFTANDNYWGGKPKTNQIIWKIISSNQITSQLQSGELDVAFAMQEQNRPVLASVSSLKLTDAPSAGMVGLYLRTAAPALSDPRVRQALYYGIDRAGLVKGVMKGQAKVLWNPPGLSYDDLNQYAYDPGKAKSLLAAAGWKPDTTLRLVYWSDAQQAKDVLPIIQQELGQIGVKVTLVPLTENDWNDMVTNPSRVNQWDIDYEFGGTFGLGPSFSADQYAVCSGPVGETGFKNCDVADLFNKAAATTDKTAQATYYHQAAVTINGAPDVVYLWQPNLLAAQANTVSGVTVYPFDRYSLLTAAGWSKQ
jgi:peptide/nickel transport system substrate-binding protein